MPTSDWFSHYGPGRDGEFGVERVRHEPGVGFDPASDDDLRRLRADSERMARGMDAPDEPPPMLWSGIPYPRRFREPSCGYQLVVSIGGTKTEFALLRLEDGRLRGLDLESGKEVSRADEILRIKDAARMDTPRASAEVPTGAAMIRRTVEYMAEWLRPHLGGALEECAAIYLSWGYAHRIVRTAPALAGGLAGVVTKMTKDQAAFTHDLRDRNVGDLFRDELATQLGWQRPVAIANDTVMALYYFLGPDWRRFRRTGLFINGTGTNFALAEAYAVRAGGYISEPGEEYVPDRITPRRPLRAGETRREFFVNYEAGGIELDATRSRFDTEEEYQIERNALAGGHALPQQFREFVRAFLAPELFDRVRSAGPAGAHASYPGALEVGRLSASDGTAEVVEGILGAAFSPHEAAGLRGVARLVVNRSALHVALVLNAVTLRNGFGRGGDGRADLLAMEGSVWKIPAYPALVHGWWQALAGPPLAVELHAEPTFNASLPGPLFLAALQPEEE